MIGFCINYPKFSVAQHSKTFLLELRDLQRFGCIDLSWQRPCLHVSSHQSHAGPYHIFSKVILISAHISLVKVIHMARPNFQGGGHRQIYHLSKKRKDMKLLRIRSNDTRTIITKSKQLLNYCSIMSRELYQAVRNLSKVTERFSRLLDHQNL